MNKKLLFIEDNEDYRRIVALQLQAAGYVCLAVPNHKDGLRILRDNPDIDTVLLDYTVGTAGPDSFVGEARNIRAALRIIGHSTLNRCQQFLDLGVQEFMLKPLNFKRFINLLQSEPADEAWSTKPHETSRFFGSE